MRTVFIVILLILTATVSAAGPKNDLKGIKQEIRVKKKLITKTKKVEETVSTELKEINSALDKKKADLGKLDRELDSVESGLAGTRGTISSITDDISRKKREIDRRLVSIYKAGEFGTLRMFFSAESLPQMAENIRYMRSVLDNDKRITAEYNAKIDQLNRLKTALERDMSKKESLKQGIAFKKHEIEKEKNRKSAYLIKVRNDRKSYESSLKELQANASRLQTMIQRLDERSRKKPAVSLPKQGRKTKYVTELPLIADKGFASQKGRLSMPVHGEVIETYGKHKHSDFNAYTFNKGIYIAAGAGSEIRSVYAGSVIFADYFKGYGNMVIIDHGGGYFSLYAHASRIAKKVGAEVAKNEVVAAVGDSDSSRGAVLYFEIRHQGKPVDPAGWVR